MILKYILEPGTVNGSSQAWGFMPVTPALGSLRKVGC